MTTPARLLVERVHYGVDCTLGLMRWPGALLWTCEDAWSDNKVGVSCIPDGVYSCHPRRFYRGNYDAIEIEVPGRTTILIHRGNTALDVTGCIVIGLYPAAFGGHLGVANSATAWARFFAPAWLGREFELEIRPLEPLAGTRKAA